MSYENFLIMEQEGRAAYQLGDTTCSDCNQVICACESLAEWHNERDNNFPVPVLAEAKDSGRVEVKSEARESTNGRCPTPAPVESGNSRGGENLQEPTSFSQWLEQNGDSI